MRKLLVTSAAIAMCVAAMPKAAEAVLITSPGASVTVGDKIFNNFTCSFTGGNTGAVGSCDTVNATGATDAAGNFGLNFQINAVANAAGQLGDYQIGYIVTAPAATITDIHLSFNGSVQGSGFTDVSETVRTNPGGVVVGNIVVTNPPPVFDKSANVTGGPYMSLSVLKDVQFGVPVGATGINSASISQIGQFVSQVPEPASMALFGLAALGASLRRRARK